MKKPSQKPGRDEIEQYEERAAIMEYDGGLPKEIAEDKAWKLVFGNRYSRQTHILYTPYSRHY